MIDVVSAMDVLIDCRRTLGLERDMDTSINETFLAALVRRSAGINCPCSRATLRATLIECIRDLPSTFEKVEEKVDETIEALIVGGDLLDLSDVTIDDSNVKRTWVFAAPPSFVIRPSRSIFLSGVVPDQDTFLPSELMKRVQHRGYARVIEQQSEEDLAQQLGELGLQQISTRTWLKCPPTQSPEELLSQFKLRLAENSVGANIEDLQILDWSRSVTYYQGRWTSPKDQTGTFIARRPQEFGAPVWSFVELREGNLGSLLDLPISGNRWRGCDSAWHIQAAIDHCFGKPQQYRCRLDCGRTRFDFFSPLPQWAERRLMILGEKVPKEKCLFSYVVPSEESNSEEEFLQENLWLSRVGVS